MNLLIYRLFSKKFKERKGKKIIELGSIGPVIVSFFVRKKENTSDSDIIYKNHEWFIPLTGKMHVIKNNLKQTINKFDVLKIDPNDTQLTIVSSKGIYLVLLLK